MQVVNFKDFGFHRTIRYRGIFDFDGLLRFMVKWIKDRDFDFYEKKILDKPPYKIYSFEGRKKVDYIAMLIVSPEVWLIDAKEVEVIKEGKVKKLMEGQLKIIINGGYILDYDGNFEKSAGLKKIETFLFDKVLYHETLLKYFDYMDYYLYGYMTDIKKFLEMETATNAY